MVDLLDDLAWRGLIYQQTNADGLRRHLAGGSRAIYCGFDPTADSLTVGNLVPLMLLLRFQEAGHRPVVIMGGGTGLIGDPSGKEAERPILSRERIEQNIAGQRRIFERLLRFDGPAAAEVANNADWLEQLSFVEVLRDIGKHFSVNMMIQRDSVRERLQSREQGISYTEFSYMLLQAYDFLHLLDARQVTLQVAGSDQWGNIVAGVDLVRRVRQAEVYGLTAPLLTRADGGKFGKTEADAVWLTADRTSPYDFYQFWLNSADADVIRYLKVFTLLPREEIEVLEREHAEDPARRTAQRALARHMTEVVHGSAAREQAEAAARALFSGEVTGLPEPVLEQVFAQAPSSEHRKAKLAGDGLPLLEVLVEARVVSSKRQARELLTNGAITVNGRKAGVDSRLTEADLLHGRLALVRRGKKTWHVTRWG